MFACWPSCKRWVYSTFLGMALFIFYTACAMMMRWVPGVKEVDFDQRMSTWLPGAIFRWFSWFIFLTHIRSRCVLGCFQSACWQYLPPGGLLLLQLQLFGKLFHKSYNSNIFYCLRSTFIQNQISKGLVRTLIPCV